MTLKRPIHNRNPMRVLRAFVVIAALAGASCTAIFGKQYEYEEQWTIATDGSAVVIIDASVPALVALRGVALNPSPTARIDTKEVRAAFEAMHCQVDRVAQPWRRDGRRFVQVLLSVDDVRRAGTCDALSWSHYSLDREETTRSIHYHQVVGPPAAGGNPGTPTWNGSELVAIKLHLPSKITYQNVKRLEDGSNGTTERGNILTWEQRFADRRAGAPIDIDVVMDAESILYRTLWLFGGAMALAILVMIAAASWIIRIGRRRSSNPASSTGLPPA